MDSSDEKLRGLDSRVLQNVREAIKENDPDRLRPLLGLIADGSNPLGKTNIVILACKLGNVEFLERLLSQLRSMPKLLLNGESVALPGAQDESGRDAFYYAVRSGDVKLLRVLIEDWPNNYFQLHERELDRLLSRAYRALKLKNVSLTLEMEFFIQDKLVDLRFFSSACAGQNRGYQGHPRDAQERIRMVLESIRLLIGKERVDDEFLLISRYTCRNLHLLKRQLKCTYDRLPWEEIEFCLAIFIRTWANVRENDFFCQGILSRMQILKHLGRFSNALKEVECTLNFSNSRKLGCLPKTKRIDNVTKILSDFPQFQELYDDHYQVRDIHSLERISEYIQLAVSADPSSEEGQVAILRSLQVVGEHMKNTLEAPKLSPATGEGLLAILPDRTRDILSELRNSLSHSFSLSQRVAIEESSDTEFFLSIQDDAQRISGAVDYILCKNKSKMIKAIFQKVANLDDVHEAKEIFTKINVNENLKKYALSSRKTDIQKLADLLEVLKIDMADCELTQEEADKLERLEMTIETEKNKNIAIQSDVFMQTGYLSTSLNMLLAGECVDENAKIHLRFCINNALRQMNESDNINNGFKSTVFEDKPNKLRTISDICLQLLRNLHSKMPANIDKIHQRLCSMIYITDFEVHGISGINELNDHLKKKLAKTEKNYSGTKLKSDYNDYLERKLRKIREIFSEHKLRIEPMSLTGKEGRQLQATLEMLILDVLAVLGTIRNCLEDNPFFLDNEECVFVGKALRNYLAHGDVSMEVLTSDPTVALLCNARRLAVNDFLGHKQKIGKATNMSTSEMRNLFLEELNSLAEQERMFTALEKGDLEKAKVSMKRGADILGANSYFWTAAHFVAKGGSVEAIEFLLLNGVNLNCRNFQEQTPLHLAAIHGHSKVIEFLLKNGHAEVCDVDDSSKTALHFAAEYGHLQALKVLLRYGAKVNVKDMFGNWPIHKAVMSNRREVVEFLMRMESETNTFVRQGGFTLLHLAAEVGHVELTKFFIARKVDVRAEADAEVTALHLAALGGHSEVVDILIAKRANVNARVVSGCTPLHYAVECSNEEVASLLLRHGANPNICDKTYFFTPLHYAAQEGHEGIARDLLRHGARLNIVNRDGLTPLHFAIIKGFGKMVNLFLESGVDQIGKTSAACLHLAVYNGHREIVELLIAKKFNVDESKDENFKGLRPIHLAAAGGLKEIVSLLVNSGANIELQSYDGCNPLHFAAGNGHEDVVRILIERKLPIDAKSRYGLTSLHSAVLSGKASVVDLLIQCGANVNARSKSGDTPLHFAAVHENLKIILSLIKNSADVDAQTLSGLTPLDVATMFQQRAVVELLIKNKSNMTIKDRTGVTAFVSSIQKSYTDIVEVFLRNGVDVNADEGAALFAAIKSKNKNIVKLIFDQRPRINVLKDGISPLHLAATVGNDYATHLLIKSGIDVNTRIAFNNTPLHSASMFKQHKIMQILLESGADVNCRTDDGFTALHNAALKDDPKAIDTLLKHNVDVHARDNLGRTAFEISVGQSCLQSTQSLLSHGGVDVNSKGNDDYTALHIAAQYHSLDMLECLVNKGADLHARNRYNSKPIHIAARSGHWRSVKFFFDRGMSATDLGILDQTLLHYAAISGSVEIAKYLLEKGLDVNAKDCKNVTALHMASEHNQLNFVKFLLENGAMYDVQCSSLFSVTPIHLTKNADVHAVLSSIHELFQAVNKNDFLMAKKCIESAGTAINARNANGITVLHIAAWKGFKEIVNLLMEKSVNPNVTGKNGASPLHYAAKFSHFEITKALLAGGASYDMATAKGNTPLDLTKDERITSLLKLIAGLFKSARNRDVRLLRNLRGVKDAEIMKLIMRTVSAEKQTLVSVALRNDFSNDEELYEVWQDDLMKESKLIMLLELQERFDELLSMYQEVARRRRDLFGADNPATLNVQHKIALSLYKQFRYEEALKLLEEIVAKQIINLGENNKVTLKIKSDIALILHRMGRNEDALEIYRELCDQKRNKLASDDPLDAQVHMALVLNSLEKYDEALKINKEVYEKMKKKYGAHNPYTLIPLNNIAMVLANQENYEESLKIYRKVYEGRMKSLGPTHSMTLKTLAHIAGVLAQQNEVSEALRIYQNLLETQRKTLGPDNFHTLNTEDDMAHLLVQEGKHTQALQMFNRCFEKRKALMGPKHPQVVKSAIVMESLQKVLPVADILSEERERKAILAAKNGDIKTLKDMIRHEVNLKYQDCDGRTALHFAAESGDIDAVTLLLNSGAEAASISKKGNTPLHIAVSKGHRDVSKILVESLAGEKRTRLVNAKTTGNGTTSLHVAAKNGCLPTVLLLLQSGAIFNIKDFKGLTPADLSKSQEIACLLENIRAIFDGARAGDLGVAGKLQRLDRFKIEAVMNSRDDEGKSLLQVAISRKHGELARSLLVLLKGSG